MMFAKSELLALLRAAHNEQAEAADKVWTRLQAEIPVQLNRFAAYVTSRENKLVSKYLVPLMNKVCLRLGLPVPVADAILVRPNEFATTDWGPLYWTSLHYLAFLIQKGLAENKLEDSCNFVTVIWCLNWLVPCASCAAHFESTADSPEVRHFLKLIAYGCTIEGLYHLHNYISYNISIVNGYSDIFKPFSFLEYTQKYGWAPFPFDRQTLFTDDYVREMPTFCSELHLDLLILVTHMWHARHSGSSMYLSGAHKLLQNMYESIAEGAVGSRFIWHYVDPKSGSVVSCTLDDILDDIIGWVNERQASTTLPSSQSASLEARATTTSEAETPVFTHTDLERLEESFSRVATRMQALINAKTTSGSVLPARPLD